MLPSELGSYGLVLSGGWCDPAGPPDMVERQRSEGKVDGRLCGSCWGGLEMGGGGGGGKRV